MIRCRNSCSCVDVGGFGRDDCRVGGSFQNSRGETHVAVSVTLRLDPCCTFQEMHKMQEQAVRDSKGAPTAPQFGMPTPSNKRMDSRRQYVEGWVGVIDVLLSGPCMGSEGVLLCMQPGDTSPPVQERSPWILLTGFMLFLHFVGHRILDSIRASTWIPCIAPSDCGAAVVGTSCAPPQPVWCAANPAANSSRCTAEMRWKASCTLPP